MIPTQCHDLNQHHPQYQRSRLFLVLLRTTLRLRRTSELLGSVLSLLALLSAGLLDLGCVSNSDESVVGLELLHGLDAVVDEGETGRLATTVLCPHTEDVDLVLVGLVHFGESGAQVVLGDVGSVGVEDITVERVHVSLAIRAEISPADTQLRDPGTYTTICLRDRSRLVMNLRVRMVTGESAMIAKMCV